ncbi:MAG: hypothetical protein HY231_18790 [Acidobacteria bacterium]|nr:hypothetical protein [Acidobacteriota bacterium]
MQTPISPAEHGYREKQKSPKIPNKTGRLNTTQILQGRKSIPLSRWP